MNALIQRPTRWALPAIALVAIVLPLDAADVSPKQQPTAAETFVYVHGAWNGGFWLKSIERLLRAQGHEVYRPTLTGLGERVHLAHRDIDLDIHIQDIVNVIVWEELRDVVLVGRSYGGMVIAGVVDRVPERIKRVIYLDAFLPTDGESLLEISKTKPKVQSDGFVLPPGRTSPGKAPPHMVPQPEKTFTQKISLRQQDAVVRIPTTYILTVEGGKRPEDDEFFRFYERAQSRGWKVVVMEADHGPEASRPEEILKLLTQP
jgi:pimeloyl-ACP methyl ester carboxylesterase